MRSRSERLDTSTAVGQNSSEDRWNRRCCSTRRTSRSRSSTGRRRSRSGARGRSRSSPSYDREIRAVSFSFKLPSVIRLLRYIKIKRRFDYVPFSRANIYARDDHRCQYCGDGVPDERADLRSCGAGRPGRPQGLGEHRHLLRARATARKGGRTPAEAGMHLHADAEAPDIGAGHPHHGRASQRARELARLPLLERRARRYVMLAPVPSSPPVHPLCGRSKAAASPSKAPDFPSTIRQLPEVRIGDAPARVVVRLADAARPSIVPGRPRGRTRRRCASTGVPGETAFVDIARAVRHRAAPGRQPGVRSRRQSLRHLQRHARPAGAGVDLPRAARTARARRSRRASSTRRRWRSIPRDGCTCRAGSKARSTA